MCKYSDTPQNSVQERALERIKEAQLKYGFGYTVRFVVPEKKDGEMAESG